MSAHTPWRVVEGYDRDSTLKLHRVISGASIVAECYGLDSGKHARLIAAAPNLLKELEELLGYVMCNFDMSDDYAYVVAARAAIAKARGEA